MKLFCIFIILMSFVQMQMAGPAYPPSPHYNSGGYLQGQAYSSRPAGHSYNTVQSIGGLAYYTPNAGAVYNSGHAYSAGGSAGPTYNAGQYLGGQAYSSGTAGGNYNAAGQAYSSGTAGGNYNAAGQAYSSGTAGGNYNPAGQAYSSGAGGSSYVPGGQSSNSAGAASNAGQSLAGQLLDIMVPQVLLEDFEYVPTKEGYRFSYKLADGTTREEIGIITNPGGDNQGLVVMGAMTQTDPNDPNSSTTSMFSDDDKKGFRPRGMVKSRKLSPKSLQSLAG